MPPRIARSSVPRKNPKAGPSKVRAPKKSAKRALDAFSIAAKENPEKLKVSKHRLGESDLASSRSRKRHRDEDDEDEEGSEEEASEAKRRKQRSGDPDDMSFDEGSDSEGNQWTMGHVGSDDDESIDSDEAFGESDEERFEGWVFRGSSSRHQGGKKAAEGKKRRQVEDEDVDMDGEIDLDEGESADGEEEEDDDLGEDAIDLATALDQYGDSEEDEEDDKKDDKRKKSFYDDSEPSEGEDPAADGFEDSSSEDEDDDDKDEDEADRRAQLKDLISSLPEDEEPRASSSRKVDVHENATPSEFGVSRKVDILGLKSKISDPEKKKSLNLIRDDKKPSKRSDISRKLEAPLPKRQQDKLDRAAASEKANETLGRWVDTVKQNRRAEHLVFPLQHPKAGESMGESRLQPTTTEAPANDLEAAIQSILQQSGLSNGKDDDEQFQKWEELQTNKLPLEEVQKRRVQLRKERELLFREEVRAKRIKKIKSKAYRRVHRKERERLLQKEKDALRAEGVEVSEDEREYNDRRRAEERMGAKHRESKWAKGIKQSGRAVWDEDAKAGVSEMARRNEELRRRIEGKEVRDKDEDASDFSSEDEEDVDSDEDRDQVLQRQLGRLKTNPFSTSDDSKLGNMAFMQKAEAARKARNDEDVERMRRELAGEEIASEDEDDNATRVGRRKFGPGQKTSTPVVQIERSEFEERPGFDEEAANEVENNERPVNGLSNGSQTAKRSKTKASQNVTLAKKGVGVDNPYLTKALKQKKSDQDAESSLWKAQDTIASLQTPAKAKSKLKSKAVKQKDASDEDEDELPEPQISAPDEDGFMTVTYGNNPKDDDDDEVNGDDIEDQGVDLELVHHNNALTAKAFAGDEDEEAFIADKRAAIEEEASKTETSVLPGWGAWTGQGLSSSEKRHKGKKSVTKTPGIDPSKRKDAKLDRVIVNEKRVKKNAKFLASSLPFPYETKEQYERSLRLPKGPQWTTKRTFQEATKPRVIVKQGIVRPMSKPL
ncbi:Utp14 protein-domain-containing protein, partial [Lophiotrema nucula]